MRNSVAHVENDGKKVQEEGFKTTQDKEAATTQKSGCSSLSLV
jgi:hypothetical protein